MQMRFEQTVLSDKIYLKIALVLDPSHSYPLKKSQRDYHVLIVGLDYQQARSWIK